MTMDVERSWVIQWLGALALGAILLSACQPAPTPSVEPEISPFDHPQAVAFVGSLLVVSNTGYGNPHWRPGYLSVIDVDTELPGHTIPTSRLNPQQILRHGEHLFVVNTGTYDFSDFEHPRSDTPGSVDVFDTHTLREASAPTRTLELETSLDGPIDIAFSSDVALITSALRASYLIGRLADNRLSVTSSHDLPGEKRLSLSAVRTWSDLFMVVDFNSDTLTVVDPAGTTLCQVELGQRPEEMEGAMAPVVVGNFLYVLMALSGELRRADLSRLPTTCDVDTQTVVAPLGQVPNHLHIKGDSAFVVHSGDNHVAEFSLSTGTEINRWVLPVGSNPWSAAFSDDGRWMAASTWANSGVTLFNLEAGTQEEIPASRFNPSRP